MPLSGHVALPPTRLPGTLGQEVCKEKRRIALVGRSLFKRFYSIQRYSSDLGHVLFLLLGEGNALHITRRCVSLYRSARPSATAPLSTIARTSSSSANTAAIARALSSRHRLSLFILSNLAFSFHSLRAQ